MEVSSLGQLKSFLIYILLGAFLAMVFDYQRSRRKVHGTSDLLTAFSDALFLVISIVLSVLVCYKTDGGILRYYQLLGGGFGAAVYAALLSKYFIRIFCGIVKTEYCIRSYIKRALCTVFYPVKKTTIFLFGKTKKQFFKIYVLKIRKKDKKAGK